MRYLPLAVTVLLAVDHSAVAEMRQWTAADGSGHVTAEYVTFQAEKVWLHRNDGRVFGVPLASLSEDDQHFVRQEIRRHEKEKSRPTARLAGRIDYGPGRTLATLASERIAESSGLACSRKLPGCFWTHNDSGDEARLYLFDRDGRDMGSCKLDEVFAYDWEDIASFEREGRSYLLVGDCGNNGLAADVHSLYLVEEPQADLESGVQAEPVPVAQLIHFSFEDDHRDCEAIAVDAVGNSILLASKQRDAGTLVYELPWPEPAPNKAFRAWKIAELKIPTATAMDISPDGLRAVILTYDNAFEFQRRSGQSWSEAFADPPREIVVPERIQGESICYGSDGKTLYLTSEKRPTPLIQIPAGD